MVIHILLFTPAKTGNSLSGTTAASHIHRPPKDVETEPGPQHWAFLGLALCPSQQVSGELAVLSETENLGEK